MASSVLGAGAGATGPGALAKGKGKGRLTDAIDLTRTSAFQPSNGARKLVIKNLRPPNPVRDAKVAQYYAQTEKDLEAALDAILAGRKPAVPFERLFRAVEDLCRKGDADRVYCALKERMEKHVYNQIMPRIKSEGGNSNYQTLKSLQAHWSTFNAQMILIRSTFSYLDKTYLLRQKLLSINEMTIVFFRKMAFPPQPEAYETSLGKMFVTGVCDLIEDERRGTQLEDTELLKGAIRLLYILNTYDKYFEPYFLERSRAFFREYAESQSTSPLKTYIQACETLLAREQHRILQYNIDSGTEKILLSDTHSIVIKDYTAKLLDQDSLAKLLSNKDVASVRGLYQLLRLSQIQKDLRKPWTEYVWVTVADIIKDKEHGDEMVLRLLEHRRSLDVMVRDAFSKDDEFLWGMRDSFGRAMNDRNVSSCWDTGISKVGEMIAKHIDMLLRGGIKSLPKELLSDAKDQATAEREGQASTADEDAELDRQLDRSLELVRLISGKDAVEAFYKKDLARRLLMGRSASQDAERNMLAKLRSECGSSFTHTMEQMFKDQELAKDEMESYRQWCKSNLETRSALDLNVMVLSAAAWPTYPDVHMNQPDEVARQSERFERFYKGKHTGRTLTWKHTLAHCSLKARFARGERELLVSGFQAVVLLLFNSVPTEGGFLAYEQIATATGLKGPDLDRTLQSLACGKLRVIKKHPQGRDVKSTDTFTFNKAFWDPRVRVKINQIQLKETKEENKNTHERIAQDRRFETQAAIVRIMKSRKKMGHAELQAEVINMTKQRGSVEPAAIKKEIESLMEKDYLEREGNSYVYLA